MVRVATVVPDETDLLCEGCGYLLNGLPTESNCPECGKPISQSIGIHRRASDFEQAPSRVSFIATTRRVIFAPTAFFRELSTRSQTPLAKSFARVHMLIASVLFAAAATGHLFWILGTFRFLAGELVSWVLVGMLGIGIPAVYVILTLLTRLAAWLSAIEGRYWGMRLPHAVVRRGLQFHSAHYLPVGLLAVVIVWGYRILVATRLVGYRFDDVYLYTLCGAVIISAGYLFRTYWIAMKSMMFANR